MKVNFHKSFYRDLDKIKNPKTASKILNTIEALEKASSLSEISGIKKMKGATNAYRIRIGNFRMGFYELENGTLDVSRILLRKDIYKFFP